MNKMNTGNNYDELKENRNKLTEIYDKLPKTKIRTKFRIRLMQLNGWGSERTFYRRLNAREITEAEIMSIERAYQEIEEMLI